MNSACIGPSVDAMYGRLWQPEQFTCVNVLPGCSFSLPGETSGVANTCCAPDTSPSMQSSGPLAALPVSCAQIVGCGFLGAAVPVSSLKPGSLRSAITQITLSSRPVQPVDLVVWYTNVVPFFTVDLPSASSMRCGSVPDGSLDQLHSGNQPSQPAALTPFGSVQNFRLQLRLGIFHSSIAVILQMPLLAELTRVPRASTRASATDTAVAVRRFEAARMTRSFRGTARGRPRSRWPWWSRTR